MLSAIIITKNEEKNIKRVIESVNFCDEIILIDCKSDDETCKIAKKHDVKVYQYDFKNDFSALRNHAEKKVIGDFVLFLDADELVSKLLADEIVRVIKNGKGKYDAYYIKRRDWFWGRELKYGELLKARTKGILRLYKRNSGKWIGAVHEEYHTQKTTTNLVNYLDHYPHQTLKEFISDVNFYSTLRAQELFKNNSYVSPLSLIIFPFGKFVYTYFIKLGFLDGVEGFVYSFMMSFHSFLTRSKLILMYKKT